MIIGIVFLFLSTSYIQIVTANEEKPDLIIDDIFLYYREPTRGSFRCTIKNIGNSPIPGHTSVELDVKVYRLLFRIIPIPIKSYISQEDIYRTLIGETTVNTTFLPGSDLPIFGFFRIVVTINPNRIIDESTFDNNMYYVDCWLFLHYGEIF